MEDPRYHQHGAGCAPGVRLTDAGTGVLYLRSEEKPRRLRALGQELARLRGR